MADTPTIPTSRIRIEIPDNEGNLRGKYSASAKLQIEYSCVTQVEMRLNSQQQTVGTLLKTQLC